MTQSAFTATFSDWRVIKTRACVQLVFEIPIEKADEAYQVLGGMPIAAHEVWCAIARLSQPETVETAPRLVTSEMEAPAGDVSPKKSQGQIAGYLCTLPGFQKFLQEKFPDDWHRNSLNDDEDWQGTAKECIYDICAVTSRSQLTEKNTEWMALRLAFDLWMRAPVHGVMA